MTAPRKPQDRKAPAGSESDCFTFTHDGTTHTLKPTLESLSPGFMRKIRKFDDLDAFFTMLEVLADDEQLAVIDDMSHEEFGKLSEDFFEHLGATRGESTAS